MKISHLACLKSGAKNSGVVSQMSHEAKIAREYGFDWDVKLWSSDETEDGICKSLGTGSKFFVFRRFIFFKKIKQSMFHSEVVLLRYMPLDFMTLFFSKKEKRKLVIVHHTLRRQYLLNIKVVGTLLLFLDDIIQRILKRKVLGIIGVTDEILESENKDKKLIGTVYPNAININGCAESLLDQRKGKVKLAFIASQFYYWNGLELLLDSFRDEHEEDFELILVGRLTSQRQRDLVADYSSYVTHFEYMSPAQLSELYAKVDLSLGAFSLEKVGLTEACTLKVRESLAHGVAVYSGHHDTTLTGTEFYFEGPANIGKIIKVAKQMRSFTKLDVFAKSQIFIDKKIFMEQLLNEYDGVHK